MSSFEEMEQVEFSRLEKVLAAALVVFLLIGGSWMLGYLERVVPRPSWDIVQREYDLDSLRSDMRDADIELMRSNQLLMERRGELADARVEYEFRREEYRTRLDAGVDDPDLRAAHELARDRMESVEQLVAAAEAVVAGMEATLAEARLAHDEATSEVSREFSRLQSAYELKVFSLRLAYALPVFLLALVLWNRFRLQRTGYLPVITSLAAFAALQLLFLMGQYAWTLFREAAQLAISIGGSAVTIGGLVAVRRMLSSPDRQIRVRLRRRQCPTCAFPLAGGDYCQACGRKVVSDCPACGEPVLIHALYCHHCGSSRKESPGKG